jgi:integrase
MPKRKPSWSKIVSAHGQDVRVFERTPGGVLYIVPVGARQAGARRSLGHRDRRQAEDDARALAKALAGAELAGVPSAERSFGELRRAYLRERVPMLRPARAWAVQRALDLLAAYLEPGGRPFRMDDFGQHQVDGYAEARRSGRLHSDDYRSGQRAADGTHIHTARDGTIGTELKILSAMCNWAVAFKTNGRRLLAHNPVRDAKLPKEANVRRPVASAERFRKLVEVAGEADASGQLRAMLALAYFSARRISAICHLRVADLLLTRAQVRAAAAALGMDENVSEEWAQAIRWRGEFDKKGYETLAPIGAELRRELDAYLRRHPSVGEAWLFEYSLHPGQALPRNAAKWRLAQAEKLAKLPHLEHGGWHAFRRAWASQRRHLPVQDVAAAGGWRDIQALQTAYQHADAATMRAVMELGS